MKKRILFTSLALLFAPSLGWACACGCGVFDVGTGSMLPTSAGGTAWLEYDFMNQSKNWSGSAHAPAANNTDKQIRTDFLTAGAQYMVNRQWGVAAEIPYWDRHFKTLDDNGDPARFHSAGLGDVRLKGIYSGFSEDMSTGVSFGLKLPTGNTKEDGFDRDTQIGTGSTDLLLGAYHVEPLADGTLFNWFSETQWQHAVTVQSHYRPGDEINAATGVYYNAGDLGAAGKIAPLLQLIGSHRWHDDGQNAASNDTGYTRLMISPGVEYDIKDVKLYGDVEVPVYQNVNGNQLIAPVLMKVMVGYSF